MLIKEWLTDNNTDFKITSDDFTLYTSDTVKAIFNLKYGNYTLLYDTKADNNSMWQSYTAMIQHNIDKLYNLLYEGQDIDLTEITETILSTDTYNLKNENDISVSSTKTNTGTDNRTITDNTGVTVSGNDTSQVYAYNSSDFENSDKTITSSTTTNSGSLTNNNTKDLSEGYTETKSNDTDKTGTVSTSKSRTVEDNTKIVDDILKLLPVNIKTNILSIILFGFIQIGAYLDRGVFDD